MVGRCDALVYCPSAGFTKTMANPSFIAVAWQSVAYSLSERPLAMERPVMIDMSGVLAYPATSGLRLVSEGHQSKVAAEPL